MTQVQQALACLAACVVGWVAALSIMWHVNPETRAMVKKAKNADGLTYALAVFGFFAFLIVLVMQGCAPYQQSQAAEKPECQDVALATITATCVAQIKATPSVTEKNRLRAECLERVDAWERCSR